MYTFDEIENAESAILRPEFVKITKKNYKLYKNFSWKTSKTKVYKKTYTAKYRYKHENGNKYLALYTKSGKFVGYINAKAAKVVK